MTNNPIHKELIKNEIKHLNDQEKNTYLVVSIRTHLRLLKELEIREINLSNPTFLQNHWRDKLSALIEVYDEKTDGTLSLLTEEEQNILAKYVKISNIGDGDNENGSKKK